MASLRVAGRGLSPSLARRYVYVSCAPSPVVPQSRPPTRKSTFVLSNVGGGALNAKMYGCCLTAYRKEVEEEGDDDDVGADDDDEYGGGAARGASQRTALWWPVVLFLLSRYPIVPQLQLM